MATTVITCAIADLPKIFQKLGERTRPALLRGAKSAAAQMLPLMVRATDNAPPASPRGSKGAVNTAAYRQRWKTLATTGPGGSLGVLVSNDSPYAGVIEYGRRPGARRPPVEPIARWAQRKLGLPYKNARSMAFVIARRIGQRGLLPRRVLTSEQTTRLLLEALERDVLHELLAELRST